MEKPRRNVFITGGTGLIGKVLVESLVNDDFNVIFTTRSKEKAKEIFSDKSLYKNKIQVIEVDFYSDNALDLISNQIKCPIDSLIHNARSIDTLRIDESGKVSSNQFADEFFMGVIFPYQLSNKIMTGNNDLKDIIFISSIYGLVAPNPSLYNEFDRQSPINYGVVKSAQIHLSKELAVRLSFKDIRVNTIAYGGVEGRVDKEFKLRYSKLNPQGRMLTITDLYPPISYILNNPNLSITGEILKVDGGWTIW